MFADEGYTILETVKFTITGNVDELVGFTTDKTEYGLGEPIMVTALSFGKNWIGIYEKGTAEGFEKFLKENGLDYSLEFEEVDGKHTLMALFNNGKKKVTFNSVASTGTKALFLLINRTGLFIIKNFT